MDPLPSGRIVLVPTPIGNRDDLTLRALEVLKSADRIACEDTRHSSPLLAHHGIPHKPLVSLHEHNEARRIPELVAAARAGDAGEHVLIGFAGEEIAVLERFLAEVGEQRIAAAIDGDIESARMHLGLARIIELRGRIGLRLARRFGSGQSLCLRQFHRRHVVRLHPFRLAKIHLNRPRYETRLRRVCSCLVRLGTKPRS